MEVLDEVIELSEFDLVLIHLSLAFILIIIVLSHAIADKIVIKAVNNYEVLFTAFGFDLVLIEAVEISYRSVAPSKELPK
jgi:branched-subunit amino acid ABC-type transport system permease component